MKILTPRLPVIATVLALLAGTACTINPVTGERELVLISAAQEIPGKADSMFHEVKGSDCQQSAQAENSASVLFP